MKYLCYCLFSILFIAFFSCNNLTDDTGRSVKPTGFIESFATAVTSIGLPEKLSHDEYITWVKDQNGITFSSVRNDQFLIQLLFSPPQLEAYSSAVINGENPETTLPKYLDLQKGFYYCTAECTILSESASKPIKKIDLLNALKEQLTVVKNNKDTLSNVITEIFPSQVMNQPNKLLILIPKADSLSDYRITISGSPFNLKDCQLNLTSEDIKSFPLIKL